MLKTKRNIGFGDRIFLEEQEWLTYCRRKPVRYIRHPKSKICQICNLEGILANPLQSAHLIGFDMGIIELGLTPDFLDSERNIITAHRHTCNKKAELDLVLSMCLLKDLGIQSLPTYLPDYIQEMWDKN